MFSEFDDLGHRLPHVDHANGEIDTWARTEGVSPCDLKLYSGAQAHALGRRLSAFTSLVSRIRHLWTADDNAA